MDKQLFRPMLERQIKEEFGEQTSLSTHEYVHHRKYRRNRVGGRILGRGPKSVTLLHELVHKQLTDEERHNVFPGVFDLGNFREVPKERCKYIELEKEIRDESGIDAQDVLKTTKKRVAELLDRKFSEFFEEDKSKSLKVLKTLHRFQRDYKTLFTLLAPPQKSGKPSFEVRDSYGIEGTTEEVEIISDLETHLSFEIPRERLHSITSTYGQMYSILDGIEIMLFEQAVSMCDNNLRKFLFIIQYISECVEHILQFEKREPILLPLDEHLFTYLIKLEFYHYAEANSRLLEEIITNPPPFGESWRDIGKLMANLGFKNISAQYLQRSTDELTNDFTSGTVPLIQFYSNLLSREIDISTYTKSIPLFEKLLKILSYSDSYKKVRFTIAIAAMALVLVELHKSTPYKPYW